MTDYQLIETMLLTPGGDYALLDEHMQRLARSGEELQFACPLADIEKALAQLAQDKAGKGHFRVRLLLSSSGAFAITDTAIDRPDPDELVLLAVSDKRVRSDDALLRHKTTRRQLFDEEWRRWHERAGAGEALFLNERDELTEGSRSNLFIEQGGQLLTPPLSSGLLPGTLRQQLLSKGRAREQILTLADLQSAPRIYVGNSVRNLQRGRLV